MEQVQSKLDELKQKAQQAKDVGEAVKTIFNGVADLLEQGTRNTSDDPDTMRESVKRLATALRTEFQQLIQQKQQQGGQQQQGGSSQRG